MSQSLVSPRASLPRNVLHRMLATSSCHIPNCANFIEERRIVSQHLWSRSCAVKLPTARPFARGFQSPPQSTICLFGGLHRITLSLARRSYWTLTSILGTGPCLWASRLTPRQCLRSSVIPLRQGAASHQAVCNVHDLRNIFTALRDFVRLHQHVYYMRNLDMTGRNQASAIVTGSLLSSMERIATAITTGLVVHLLQLDI